RRRRPRRSRSLPRREGFGAPSGRSARRRRRGSVPSLPCRFLPQVPCRPSAPGSVLPGRTPCARKGFNAPAAPATATAVCVYRWMQDTCAPPGGGPGRAHQTAAAERGRAVLLREAADVGDERVDRRPVELLLEALHLALVGLDAVADRVLELGVGL